MKNFLAFAFVIATQIACAAVIAGDPSLNGAASDQWRQSVMWGK